MKPEKCVLLLAGLLLINSFAGYSQDRRTESASLTGKITDAKTGAALGGASIYITEAKTGTIADNDGVYKIANVPAGRYFIEISYTGYNTINEMVEINGAGIKDFALSTAVVENEGVTVTGVANATGIRKAPVSITSIRKTELLQTPSTNIIDALAHKPGISQLTTGPGISKPIIRGLGSNRVVVVNEGVRQEGQQWGDEHGIEIDELSVNRAEILKGPASLMYGSDAMAGVINLITNVPVAEGTIKGNVLANYQTNNEQIGLNANLAGNKNGLNWNMYGTYKSAGDYRNKYDGRVLNSRFNEGNFGGYIGINKSWGYSHLIVSRFNQNLGMIEGDRDDATGKFILFAGTPQERIATDDDLSSRDLFVPKQNVQHYKITSDNNFAINKSRLKVNVGYQVNHRKEYGDPDNPSQEELFFDLKTVNYNIQWQLPDVKNWRTTIGVNGMYQTNQNKAEEVLIPEYNLFDIGAFVYVQRFFKKVTLSGGARFDNRSLDSKEFVEGSDIKFNAFTRSFSNFSGSVGASYEPADYLTFKANVARGFRAPNMAELGSNGAHEGTNRYEYGEQDLKSETSTQLDGGVDVNFEHFGFSLDAFYNRINNFVFYRKLESASGGDSLVDNNLAFRFDQDDAQLSGIEATLDIHPHPLDWLHFENSVSFVRGRLLNKIEGTDNLPLIPAPRLISQLKAQFNKAGKSLRNFYCMIEMDKTFDQDKPFFAYNTETATPGYILLNAGVGGDITSKGKTIFSWYIAGINLTNAAYQNHLSRLKYVAENLVTGRTGVFNTGRNFSFKINVPMDFSKK